MAWGTPERVRGRALETALGIGGARRRECRVARRRGGRVAREQRSRRDWVRGSCGAREWRSLSTEAQNRCGSEA